MANVYLCSDLHDMHKAIGKYRSDVIPEVVCPESNREFIRKHWRARKQDKVWMLGDICFDKSGPEFLNTLLGTKSLVLGNHCTDNTSRPTMEELLTCFDKVYGLTKWKPKNVGKFWLSHCPLHPAELRGCKNIHGHIHSCEQDFMNKKSLTYDENYINVNMDVLWPRIGEIMISIDELKDYMRGV